MLLLCLSQQSIQNMILFAKSEQKDRLQFKKQKTDTYNILNFFFKITGENVFISLHVTTDCIEKMDMHTVMSHTVMSLIGSRNHFGFGCHHALFW